MRYDKILLANPPITQKLLYGRYAAAAPVLPPLGLCYVAEELSRQGREVRLVDCLAEELSLSDLKDRIGAFGPQVVGLTSSTASFHAARQVLASLKGADPGLVTMLGGAHVSALPRRTMEECPELDIGVYGEGELTVREVMASLEDGKPLDGVAGVCHRREGAIIVNPPRPVAPDPDQFAFPARHLLGDMGLYVPNPFRASSRAVSLVSSRGCPFECAYCDRSVFGRGWRGHSADYVLREMTHLRERYGFDFFSFEDSDFMVDAGRVESLCRRLIGEGLGVGWTCSANANCLKPSLLRLMMEAGCRIVYLGLESGSPRILEVLEKKTTVRRMRESVLSCVDLGLKVYASFMIGAPTETEDDIDRTLEFALSLPLEAVSCFIYVPYPGTPLRELALRSGEVSEDWRDYCAHPSRLPFVQRGLTMEYLLAKQAEFYRRFYGRPGRLLASLPGLLNAGFLRRLLAMVGDRLFSA